MNLRRWILHVMREFSVLFMPSVAVVHVIS